MEGEIDMPSGLRRDEKKELRILAIDFGLFHRQDVKEIITTCKNYNEGQRKILAIYKHIKI